MSANIDVTTVRNTSRTSISRLVWVVPLAILASTTANLGLYTAAGQLFPEVADWAGAGPGQVIGATFVYLLIGAITFAAIARLSRRPARHYLILATIGLLLSLGLPISAGFGYGSPGTPPAGIATVITLSLMHVLAYLISVPIFIRLGLPEENRSSEIL